MPYVLSLLMVGSGAVVLTVLLVVVARRVRRYTKAQVAVTTAVADRVGLVRARLAAVHVALAERKSRSMNKERVPPAHR